MSYIQRFPYWRYAGDLPVYRSLGLRPVVVQRGGIRIEGPDRAEFWTQFHPCEGDDFTDVKFTLDVFRASDSGYAYALDVTCPCGEQVSGEDAGDLLREIYKHSGAAGHPRPGFDR